MGHQVVLVSMPWCPLFNPSIQVGILSRLLRDAEISPASRTYSLALLDHLAAQGKPGCASLTVQDYLEISIDNCLRGLGDWLFAVPPFKTPTDAEDNAYLAWLVQAGGSSRIAQLAPLIRKQVPSFLEVCVDDILGECPEVVGFTTGFNQTVPSLVMAQLLKQRCPDLKIVFGGSDCDGPMGEALLRAFNCVDVVVRGEGEPVLVALIEDLLAKRIPRPQPGLCYRVGSGTRFEPQGPNHVEMDQVPIPDYDEYFERLSACRFRREIQPAVEITMESSRGCWWGEKHHCTFCGLNGLGMAFRKKSPGRVFDEMVSQARKYHWLSFLATDAIIDMGYFQTLLPRLRDLGLDFRLFYETKANLTRDQVRLLAEAGVRHIQPGIESLSTPILRGMKKGVTAIQNVQLLKWARHYGLNVLWNIIYGLPNEPATEYHRMAGVLDLLTHLQPPSLVPLVIDRYSPYQQTPDAYGIELTGPPAYFPFILPADPDVVAEQMNLAYRFQYRHLDGRDPEDYVGEVRQKVEAWQESFCATRVALRYMRGPDFISIIDERVLRPRGRYTLEGADAEIYIMCDNCASPEQIAASLAKVNSESPNLDRIRSVLGELKEAGLVIEEDGRFLSLALPTQQQWASALEAV